MFSLPRWKASFCTVTLPLKNEHGTGRPVEFGGTALHVWVFYSYPLTKLSTRFLLGVGSRGREDSRWCMLQCRQIDQLYFWSSGHNDSQWGRCVRMLYGNWQGLDRSTQGKPLVVVLFLETQLYWAAVSTCNKLHIFNVWNFMFDTYIYLWNHHHNQDIKQTYLSPLQDFSYLSIIPPSSFFCLQETTNLFSIYETFIWIESCYK